MMSALQKTGLRTHVLGGVVAVMAAASAWAGELPEPGGEVILTVSGAIGTTNAEGAARFDLAMLMEMEKQEFTTTTIWTDTADTYTGVALKTLLDELDAQGTTIKASAINDYTIEIPVDSLTDSYPIVAYHRNGEEMPVRNKGPLWVIYPYDSSKELQSEVIYSRSIWQLDRLEVTN
ncbi:Oxidoreductase molybdopterin binding domain protein [Pseudoruegeria aquimaris]|uniref:Oxidoreductase molybdopterin binding domain protein n=1 Tax=Pseudoruegeria aquimaris TaxID=393663 RepID=A0A1Y5RGJ0_9RHOB|nr:molybdopterin-dependent oxidoreductase [Pseudoruegeria aquimaris]SLN16708.1 Oxidoreductase molybdopterin binding domain protein [Pseudoruegeria aquimaris]